MSFKNIGSYSREHPEESLQGGLPTTSRKNQVRKEKDSSDMSMTWIQRGNSRQQSVVPPNQGGNALEYEEAVDLGLNQYDDYYSPTEREGERIPQNRRINPNR